MIKLQVLSSITHSGFRLELIAKDVQSNCYRDLSAVCNSKINPAFAQLIQIGGQFLNTKPSLDSAKKRESTGTARVHVPGSLFKELHRLQVKHLVWYPGNTNNLMIWRSSDSQSNIWESLHLCKESNFKTFVHV